MSNPWLTASRSSIYKIYRHYNINRLELYSTGGPHASLPGERNPATHLSGVFQHVRYWTEISAVFPHGRDLERSEERFPADHPGQLPGQVAGRILLAEGLHVRVPDRDCRVRQARQGIQGA